MRMAVHRRGRSGPEVVLLHGIPGSAAAWTDVAGELARDHRVLVPDLLGFGDSSRPRAPGDLWADRQARSLAVALEQAGVRRACLVGHDFGGPVALALAAQRPDLVRSLGLVATNVFPDTPIPLPIRAVTWPLLGGLAAAALFSRPGLGVMLRQGTTRSLDAAAYLGDARQRAVIATIFAHALRNLADLYAPLESALRDVDVPVLVGWGDDDPFFPVAQAQRTAALARDARLAIYAGAGHFVPAERPAELSADIRRLAAT